jgi:hypothetical protein
MRTSLAWLGAAILAAAPSCNSEPEFCTVAGCLNGAEVRVPFGPAPALDGLTMTVCRNQACLTGSFDAGDAARAADLGFGSGIGRIVPPVEEVGAPHLTAIVFFEDAATTRFVLDWRAPTLDELHDGDRFRVTITSAAGEVLASLDRTVVYQHVYPNGAECDHGCKTATIDAAQP